MLAFTLALLALKRDPRRMLLNLVPCHDENASDTIVWPTLIHSSKAKLGANFCDIALVTYLGVIWRMDLRIVDKIQQQR